MKCLYEAENMTRCPAMGDVGYRRFDCKFVTLIKAKPLRFQHHFKQSQLDGKILKLISQNIEIARPLSKYLLFDVFTVSVQIFLSVHFPRGQVKKLTFCQHLRMVISIVTITLGNNIKIHIFAF